MRGAITAILAFGCALPALAAPADFAAAHEAGNWTGCVDQAGFKPYPVLLAPDIADGQNTMSVTYPDSCTGMHVPDGEAAGDATEIIGTYPSNCIFRVSVEYDLTGSALHLTYSWDGDIGAVAALRPGSDVMACNKSGAIS